MIYGNTRMIKGEYKILMNFTKDNIISHYLWQMIIISIETATNFFDADSILTLELEEQMDQRLKLPVYDKLTLIDGLFLIFR